MPSPRFPIPILAAAGLSFLIFLGSTSAPFLCATRPAVSLESRVVIPQRGVGGTYVPLLRRARCDWLAGSWKGRGWAGTRKNVGGAWTRVGKTKASCRVVGSTATNTGTSFRVLMQVEMPDFIARPDLMEQFLRWAHIELVGNSKSNFGIDKIDVQPIYLEPKWVEMYGEEPGKKIVNGFEAQLNEITLNVVMDDEIITGYDNVGTQEDGSFGKKGNTFEILGRHLQVRRVGDLDAPVSDETKAAVKELGRLLAKGFDRYYSFGSIYAEEI